MLTSRSTVLTVSNTQPTSNFKRHWKLYLLSDINAWIPISLTVRLPQYRQRITIHNVMSTYFSQVGGLPSINGDMFDQP
jgi:hypothetical protein